jgi:hypothetical protein
MADGQTYAEAVANAEVVIDEWIETARKLGRPIPEPRGKLAYAWARPSGLRNPHLVFSEKRVTNVLLPKLSSALASWPTVTRARKLRVRFNSRLKALWRLPRKKTSNRLHPRWRMLREMMLIVFYQRSTLTCRAEAQRRRVSRIPH